MHVCMQVDVTNPDIVMQHTMCAAKEWPIVPQHDEAHFGTVLHRAVQCLQDARVLSRHPLAMPHAAVGAGGGLSLHYCGTFDNPAARISLRTIDQDRFVIEEEGTGARVCVLQRMCVRACVYCSACACVLQHVHLSFCSTCMVWENAWLAQPLGSRLRASFCSHSRSRSWSGGIWGGVQRQRQRQRHGLSCSPHSSALYWHAAASAPAATMASPPLVPCLVRLR